LGIPQKARDSHFPTAPAAIYPPSSRLTVQMSYYDVCGTWGQVMSSQALPDNWFPH
jgi:hypothetical protein